MFDQPLAHTYSIVARDPATGELGAAVQSHWFSVGAVVIHAEARWENSVGKASVSGVYANARQNWSVAGP